MATTSWLTTARPRAITGSSGPPRTIAELVPSGRFAIRKWMSQPYRARRRNWYGDAGEDCRPSRPRNDGSSRRREPVEPPTIVTNRVSRVSRRGERQRRFAKLSAILHRSCIETSRMDQASPSCRKLPYLFGLRHPARWPRGWRAWSIPKRTRSHDDQGRERTKAIVVHGSRRRRQDDVRRRTRSQGRLRRKTHSGPDRRPGQATGWSAGPRNRREPRPHPEQPLLWGADATTRSVVADPGPPAMPIRPLLTG